MGRPEGARGEAGRQHDYSAAHPARGVDHRSQHPAQNQRGAAGAARRAPIRQETNPRGVSQSHLPRQRPLRRRGGRARLLRQARLRAQQRRKRAACRHHSVPLGLLAANVAERRQVAARYGAESDARERRHHRSTSTPSRSPLRSRSWRSATTPTRRRIMRERRARRRRNRPPFSGSRAARR